MKKIFIVDDVAANLYLAKKALEGTYHAYTITSAAMMFKLTEKIVPDLILLDVDMPDIDGFETIQILKTDDRFKSIPVIFLTGKNDVESELRGFELGALDFIYKPFTEPVLLKRIESHLQMDELFKTIQHKNEDLLKIQEAKDNILGMISHDLKNYMTITQSACDLLVEKYQELTDNKYVKMINDASNKAIDMLRDILVMNKIDIHQSTLPLVKQDINEIVVASLENLKIMSKYKKINICNEISSQPLLCMIHNERINRVLDNLYINAIKFSNQGGDVKIITKSDDNFAQIHVIDSGIGMDEAIISQLFKQYSKSGRVGTSGESTTGLGLYIVKQIIDQHNGSIHVNSEVGKGSEFIIKIPLSK